MVKQLVLEKEIVSKAKIQTGFHNYNTSPKNMDVLKLSSIDLRQ